MLPGSMAAWVVVRGCCWLAVASLMPSTPAWCAWPRTATIFSPPIRETCVPLRKPLRSTSTSSPCRQAATLLWVVRRGGGGPARCRRRPGVGAGECPDDEGALARPGTHHALAFEVAVRLEHPIRVDRQLGDNLLGRRQLATWLQKAKLQA